MFLFCTLCRDRSFDGGHVMGWDRFSSKPHHHTQNIVNLDKWSGWVLGPLVFAKVLNRSVGRAITRKLYEKLSGNQLLHNGFSINGVTW
jgi:hypothetical protein